MNSLFCAKITIVKYKRFIEALIVSSLAFPAVVMPQERAVQTDTSIQAGIEHDTNVYKTFRNRDGDFLTRILVKNRGDYVADRKFILGWEYQGGGKKFFDDAAQDQIIQSVSLPFRFLASPNFQVFFEPSLKYQNERNRLDDAGTDVNEDFIATKAHLRFLIGLPKQLYAIPQGSFTFFHFYPDETFSYMREEGGLSIERRMEAWTVGATYDYFKQQFERSFRKDSIHEISPYIQFLRQPFISVSYGYQFNHSNDAAFSFTNHKINFLSPFLFGKPKGSGPNAPQALFSAHLIATLQLKKYPSVEAETTDGERFLVTSSEDENFNNLILKLNGHVSRKWTIETKYTRISNELTDQRTNFSRSLYYAGARFDF